MLFWLATMSTDGDDGADDDGDDHYERQRERERVAVTTLDGISIARSYGFLCLHYHALFHTTASCFDCFSSSCRVKYLPCLAGFVRTLP